MATFEYAARVDPSRMQAGTIEAESVLAAARHLKAQGLYPIHLEMRVRGASWVPWYAGHRRLGRVGLAPLAEFTEQLADLLEAGIPLARALRLQAPHVSQSSLKASLDSLAVLLR
jgi:type II secretory pathway component PulF